MPHWNPNHISGRLPVAIRPPIAYINQMDNGNDTIMHSLKIIMAALSVVLASQATPVSAREIQTYRPAPRGLDVVPTKPLILRNNSPYRNTSPDCTTSASCYNSRLNRPIGPSGPTQAQRCRAAYQSYRAFDNTYKPFNRPRERCDL